MKEHLGNMITDRKKLEDTDKGQCISEAGMATFLKKISILGNKESASSF